MRIRRRHTICSIAMAVGFVGCIFLYFQFFSVEIIDIHQKKGLGKSKSVPGPAFAKKPQKKTFNPKHKPVFESYDYIDLKAEKDKSKEKHIIKEEEEDDIPCQGEQCAANNDKDTDDKGFEDFELGLKHAVYGIPGIDFPLGVDGKLAQQYKADSNKMFQCLHSEEKIPYDQINDDYCDCADGTDEPGTSACGHSRFFCTFQSHGVKLHNIPSSKVNDGICDCCDGSDEWKNITLPKHVALHDSAPHYGVYQVPCSNRCEKQIALAKEVLLMHKRGEILKEDYIKAAEGIDNPNELYGPQGEFFKLSQECFTKKSDKYEYTVCPFKEIKQQAFPSSSTLIGKSPKWAESKGTNQWTLRMSSGDTKQCPGMIHRETFLKFECGLTDEVLTIQETEVCQYTIGFKTPAAC